MTVFESIKPLHPILQEIVKQTSPDNFMAPYDATKVKRAIELHNLAYETDIHKPEKVVELIETTIRDLGCEYSAQLVYNYLLFEYKPTNNTDDYDWCNNLCQKLYQNKDNVRAMISTIKQEIYKREQKQKEEAEKKHQEEIERQRLEELQRKKELKNFLKTSLIIVVVIGLFLAIYIPFDYHRINKNYSECKYKIQSVYLPVNSTYKKEAVTYYSFNLPDNLYREYGNQYPYSFHLSYRNHRENYLIIDIAKNLDIDNLFFNKKRKFLFDGYKVNNENKTDSLIEFTCDKYNLFDGRQIGHYFLYAKPSPFKKSPFPAFGNYDILIEYYGLNATREVAQTIANSITIKPDTSITDTTMSGSKRYSLITTYKKYKGAQRYEYNTESQKLSFLYPSDLLKFQWKEDEERVFQLKDQSFAVCYSQDMDFMIYPIAFTTEQEIQKHSIKFPIDSVVAQQPVKISIANCNALRTNAIGYCNGKEYKYIVYQILKDNGYTTYVTQKEIISGTEWVKNPSYNPKRALIERATRESNINFHRSMSYHSNMNKFERDRYEEMLEDLYNQKSKYEDEYIKQPKIIGYQNITNKVKNEDTYYCIILGMTPQWYNKNKVKLNAIINSIQIK